MQNYKNYTTDYFSTLLIPQSYELDKHVNTEGKVLGHLQNILFFACLLY